MRIRTLEKILGARGNALVGLRGWVEVALVDREGRVKHHHAQNNLILDSGLDFVMGTLQLGDLHLYVAVGTSSTPPAATQTTLGNEIARTRAPLDHLRDFEVAVLADGHYRITRARVLDYNQGNGNLTEFGGSWASSGIVGTRELFRDPNGTPIVITKTSNERLVITYHIEVQFSPVVATDYGAIRFTDNNGNVVDSRLVRHTFAGYKPWGGSGIDLSFFTGTKWGLFGNFYWAQDRISVDLVSYRAILLTSPPDLSYGGSGSLIPYATGSAWWGAYTSGSFYRDLVREEGPGDSDIVAYGYAQVGGFYPGKGYVAAFIHPDGTPNPFPKGKDYRMRVATRFSIARQ